MKLTKYLVIYRKRNQRLSGKKILMAVDVEEAKRTTRFSDTDCEHIIEVREIGL